ncbi:MAG: GTP pyrophosphokinase family protein [Eggerthellaceae bacterium]
MSVSFSTDDREEVALAELSLDDAQKAERGIALASSVVAYKDLMMTYSCAAKIVRTKFEILDEEFRMRRLRNPIHSIDTRLKSTASIMDKLRAKGLEPTEENIIEHVRDVAGVRVVCSYVDDIYMLAEAVGRLSGIEVLETKDYISHPKQSGYRSLHLVLDVLASFRLRAEGEGGGADSHHRHGFLGKLGASASI